MAKRRSHNQYRRVYAPALMARARAYEGLPCASCQFPVLGSGVRDELGRWRHVDCATLPDVEVLEHYVLYHVGTQNGLDEDEVRRMLGSAELRARATAISVAWSSHLDGSAVGAAGAVRDLRPQLEGVTSLERIFAPVAASAPAPAALVSACDALATAARRNGLRNWSARVWTSRSAADSILRALGGSVAVVSRPPSLGPGYLVFSVQAEKVAQVQAALVRLRAD